MAQDPFVLALFGNGTPRWFLATAAPTSGIYAVGDLFINSAPAAAGTWAWVCTTAGDAASSAVFKAVATIAS